MSSGLDRKLSIIYIFLNALEIKSILAGDRLHHEEMHEVPDPYWIRVRITAQDIIIIISFLGA